jgi:hypothetical protein
VFIYIPASAAVTVWRRRTIDDVLTDGEERLLQHISSSSREKCTSLAVTTLT